MRPDSITLAIFEKYSTKELAKTAQTMAQAVSDMEGAEAQKKVSDGVFNERIKKHAAEVSELAQKYNKGGETAQIGCAIRYDIPVVGKKSYIRMDSEETVEVHDMTIEEKQETLQFPLSTQMADQKPSEPQPSADEAIANLPAQAPTEITFKDIQAIANHIAAMPRSEEIRAAAKADMQANIAEKLAAQKSCIGPDGRMEAIETAEIAAQLAKAWIELAIENASKPPAKEELTRLCPYPGCILFIEHDGMHEFPPAGAKTWNPIRAKAADTAPEPQRQKERKPRTKKRPPAEPPQPGAPA